MVRLARSLSIAVAASMGLVVSTIGAGIFAASMAQAADVFRVAYAGSMGWTAATFRNSTSSLFAVSQPGMIQAGIRNLPGTVIIGGGLIVESGGSLVGAIGVSGAPGGDADEACAEAGIKAIQGKLDF